MHAGNSRFAMLLALTLGLLAAAPLAAQDSGAVAAAERARFGHGELRPGADGNDPSSPRYANFDEAEVGDLAPPPLFADPADALPEGWPGRRAEIARLVENEWVGRIPPGAAELTIDWTRDIDADGSEHWRGLLAPGDTEGPAIDAVVTLPEGTGPVPVVIGYTYIWPPGFRLPGPPQPSLREAALARGWGHVAYRPTLLQADDLGKISEGVIGLAGWPRGEHDWGALRAWGWGASRLREALGVHPRIDAQRIALAGHSRFGKAVLVAAAFDHAFADALVSSSGAGGAKLMRRDFGERIENMADPYASIWYAPRIRHYAGRASVADWPVDAHMLIALRAPRPLMIATGRAEQGDGWTDPHGQWLATLSARAAWRVTGAEIFAQAERPEPGSGPVEAPLAFWQHGEGHVMWPAYQPFFDHAERFATPERPSRSAATPAPHRN